MSIILVILILFLLWATEQLPLKPPAPDFVRWAVVLILVVWIAVVGWGLHLSR